jgi:cytoskeletal protein RodZ
MVSFTSKDIQDRSLGETLRLRRVERGETFDDVERETGVTKKYIEALEKGEHKRLPDLVYTKKFVRRLSEHFSLDGTGMVESLIHEMTAVGSASAAIQRPVNFVHGRKIAVTPRLAKGLVAGVLMLGVVGYFALSVNRILTPPSVEIFTPKDNQAYDSRLISFEGKTEPEVELTINTEPVAIEADGSFKDVLSLPPGATVLRVTAKKKHSRERELFIKVVVEEKTAVAAATSTSEVATP